MSILYLVGHVDFLVSEVFCRLLNTHVLYLKKYSVSFIKCDCTFLTKDESQTITNDLCTN